jgi:hypothetical protein
MFVFFDFLPYETPTYIQFQLDEPKIFEGTSNLLHGLVVDVCVNPE